MNGSPNFRIPRSSSHTVVKAWITEAYGGLENIPKLRVLHSSKNDKCVSFPEEFGKRGAFPELQQLIIEEFKDLKIFPALDVNAMAKLKYLRIKGCPQLVNKPE